MNKLSQKEAVYSITQSVLAENEVIPQEGQHINEIITKDMRQAVTICLIEGFNSEDIQMDKEFNEKELRAYAQSVISNWYRKDTRLNGGTKYEPSKKGSRTGYNDSKVKAMRKMLKEVEKNGNLHHIIAVQNEINLRLKEIRKAKNADKIDIEALPEHLRHLV